MESLLPASDQSSWSDSSSCCTSVCDRLFDSAPAMQFAVKCFRSFQVILLALDRGRNQKRMQPKRAATYSSQRNEFIKRIGSELRCINPCIRFFKFFFRENKSTTTMRTWNMSRCFLTMFAIVLLLVFVVVVVIGVRRRMLDDWRRPSRRRAVDVDVSVMFVILNQMSNRLCFRNIDRLLFEK